MMHRREFIVSISGALVVATCVPLRAEMAKLSQHADAAERKFIRQASRFVHRHYSKTAAAARAGYLRFTNEDKSGAISWANQHWTSVDADHPSQLWYDASGRLIGVDYSVLQSDTTQPPSLWGINPKRWSVIHAHIHYGLHTADGIKYGGVGAKKFSDAGGSIASPTKQTLVNMGIAKSANEVAFVFLFPSIWDVNFWVVPNPNGEFADLNPNVKPANVQPHPSM
ncbi:MAG: hypothetical protein ACREML_14540, partial [Vulcanimicrobiaceae bacterium]